MDQSLVCDASLRYVYDYIGLYYEKSADCGESYYLLGSTYIPIQFFFVIISSIKGWRTTQKTVQYAARRPHIGLLGISLFGIAAL